MKTDYDNLIYQIEQTGIHYVQLLQVSNRLEELKKIVIAKLKRKHETGRIKCAQATLEMLAYSDPEYQKHIEMMFNAQAETDKAKLHYEALKNLFDAQRSHMAMQREKLSKGIV